jgi:GNAT superfamily N-acetyltransferase
MSFADLALSQRLERTEGHASSSFAEARRRAFPGCDAEWIEHAGTVAIFDGVDSPVTQSFGLGLFETLTVEALEVIERFFRARGASPIHEVSPFAGVAALSLLCSRQYRPIEISSVLYREVEKTPEEHQSSVCARLITPQENQLWADISAGGWAQDNPELLATVKQLGAVVSASEGSICFLGEADGQPGAAGVLRMHEGVALLGGSATLPAFRRRGLQGALLRERLRYAADGGCDIAMMVAEAGSNSQRNAERQGFRVAYTRIKWRLSA